MANVSVYNMLGNTVDTIELNDSVFGVEINEHLMHLAVTAQLANKRQGTQKAKTRSEVSGGGRKPWRQKGTGHARQGSTRAPQWTGGGVVFAPTPRDYTIVLNKKEKRAALKSALTATVQGNKLIVLDALTVEEVKTKTVKNMLTALQAAGALEIKKAVKKNKADKNAPKEYKNTDEVSALIVLEDVNENVILSARNIEGVKVTFASVLNVYDILSHDQLIIAKDAIAKIEEVLA